MIVGEDMWLVGVDGRFEEAGWVQEMDVVRKLAEDKRWM
jgi:hypothetical protein